MLYTLALDDNLIRTAQAYTGVMDKSALIHGGLKALREREAARKLVGIRGRLSWHDEDAAAACRSNESLIRKMNLPENEPLWVPRYYIEARRTDTNRHRRHALYQDTTEVVC